MREYKSRWPKRKSKSSAPFSHPKGSQFKSLESPLAQAREKQEVDHGPYTGAAKSHELRHYPLLNRCFTVSKLAGCCRLHLSNVYPHQQSGQFDHS